MSDATKKLPLRAALRAAKVNDVDRVQAFYHKHPHRNVLGRAEAVRLACVKGRQFIVEANGEVVAASGYYDVGQTEYVEAGGTRVSDPWGGFGLQGLFIWARVAAIALTEHGMRITTAVSSDNKDSRKHVEGHRFEPWSEPVADLLSECDPAEGRAGCDKKAAGLPAGAICCCNFYRLPPAAIPLELADFLSATEKSLEVELRRKDGATLLLRIDCASVAKAEQREILRAIARGE